ncbi:MAG TPA: sigma-54 dependent transcriptional regulator [Blastocatellia bacterium]|nr:sigma-54 dependent transcriptional regulator [Blastocatellia bacterium]
MNRGTTILIVDDETSITDALSLLLRTEGYEVETASDLGHALTAVEHSSFDLVITDLSLGGLELLKNVKVKRPATEVIIITGYGSVPQAVEATKAGAFYFLEKPFEPEQILLIAEKALERSRLLTESAKLRQHFTKRQQYAELIGSSKAMQAIYETIEHVAKTDANVLIIGDSGTGKELIANAIHFNSRRADQDFVKVNCSALPKELIEAELFGYIKGAFTGAVQDRIGLFGQANKGSLLLDELAEMPIDLQPKLLRVLEERRYRRVGDSLSREVDFRLICSTNRSLQEAIKTGLLREDLYYRISTITITVPPLRERGEDLQLLIEEIYRRFCERYERQLKGFSQAAYQRLFAYHWPGNVRELQNVIERAVLLSHGPYIEAADLPLGTLTSDDGISPEFFYPPAMKWNDIERAVLTTALERVGGNKKAAAQALGIQRSRLYNKLRKYKIAVGRQRKD